MWPCSIAKRSVGEEGVKGEERQKIRSCIMSTRRKVSSRRRIVFSLDKWECVYCGEKPEQKVALTIDHLVPQTFEGTHSIENMVSACYACNTRRGCKPLVRATLRFGRFRDPSNTYGKPSETLLVQAESVPTRIEKYQPPFCWWCETKRYVKWRRRWLIWSYYVLIGKGREDRMKR